MAGNTRVATQGMGETVFRMQEISIYLLHLSIIPAGWIPADSMDEPSVSCQQHWKEFYMWLYGEHREELEEAQPQLCAAPRDPLASSEADGIRLQAE